MASFVAPNTGIVTADDRVHKYLWVSIDDADMAAKLKTWQSWIATPKAINGITVWSYTDLLALAVEILLPGPGIADDLILTAPPGPGAIMRGLAAALGDDRPPPQSRAQGAKLLAHKARSFSPADITAVTLVPADLVQRQGTYIPVWQRITYHEAEHMGGGLTLAWLHYYDPSAVRSGLTASTALNSIRARAVAARILRPNLAAPRQPPPGPNDPQNQEQVDAAAGALAVHNLTPQPDSIPADEVKFAVLNLLGGNQYQANRQLRTDHPEGAARRAAMTEEIDSFPIGIDGLSPGYRNRLRVAIGAAGQAGDPNHLNDFLGDERQSAAGLLASMKDMAQSLLPPEMQKDALLYTTQGIRALNIALVTHAAYFEHHRAAAASAGAAAPTVEARLEQLAVRVGEIDATGGAITAAFGGGQVSSANQSGAGRTACRASWTAAAARPENARVLLWLSDMLEDESTTSVEIHRALFVSANAAHPDWRSTGFLHALGWGNINAALLDHKYALIYEYATDYYIGLYLADALVSAAVRSRLVTAAQQVWLSGLSLTALAKSLRAENWAGVDIVNDVDNAIQSELATISYRAAPPKTPLAVTFCDTVTVTRAVIFLKALMEALGLQRDGDGSVAELMTDGNAAIISNTTFSVAAMCRIVEAYQAIYKAAITATGRAYTWTHSDVNVRADLPTRNYPPTAIEGLLRNLKMLHDRLAAAEDAAATQRLLKSMGDSAPPPAAGQSNVSAAAILLRSAHSGGGADGAGGGAEAGASKRKAAKEATKADKSDKASKQPKPDTAADADKAKLAREEEVKKKAAANTAALDAATGVEVEGQPGGQQQMKFGNRTWDLTKAREQWPAGSCFAAIFAASCSSDPAKSLEYARKCCPMTTAQHPDGCAAHKIPEDATRPNALRVFPLKRGGGDKGKGKGGRGTGGGGKGGGKGKGKGSK